MKTKEEAAIEVKRLLRTVRGIEASVLGLAAMVIYIVANIIMGSFDLNILNTINISVCILLIVKLWRYGSRMEAEVWILRFVYELNKKEKEDEKIN